MLRYSDIRYSFIPRPVDSSALKASIPPVLYLYALSFFAYSNAVKFNFFQAMLGNILVLCHIEFQCCDCCH